ncbi:MAG: hypothetical protein ACP5NF_11760 [Thermoanaerobaculum sp.]
MFFVVLMILGAGAVSAGELPHLPFDGNWWMRVSRGQRAAFISGFFDCAWYERKLEFTYSLPISWAARRTTEYLQAMPEARTLSLEKVFQRVAELPQVKSRLKIDPHDVGIKPHFGFNSWFWTDSLHSRELREAYVAGYLQCNLMGSSTLTDIDTRRLAGYADEISRFYGVSPSGGTIVNAVVDRDAYRKNSSVPIGDVLKKLLKGQGKEQR